MAKITKRRSAKAPSKRAVARAVAAAQRLLREQAAQNLRPETSAERLARWAGRLAENEPVFCLRARDITAPNTVRRWAASCAELGGPAHKIGDAMLQAVDMERWQRAHGCKSPD